MKIINRYPSEEEECPDINQANITINILLGRIATLEYEVERLNNKVEELMSLYTTEREVKEDYKSIIKKLEKYVDKMSYEAVIDNPKKDLQKILKR